MQEFHVYVLIEKEDRVQSRKLDPRAQIGIHVGCDGNGIYLVYIPSKRGFGKIKRSSHVRFDEGGMVSGVITEGQPFPAEPILGSEPNIGNPDRESNPSTTIPPGVSMNKDHSPTAGHMGRDRSLLSIKRLLYWKGMDIDFEDYTTSCMACERDKPRRSQTNSELMPIPVPGRPWGSITLDMITDLPRSKRSADFVSGDGGVTPTYDAILVIIVQADQERRFFAGTTYIYTELWLILWRGLRTCWLHIQNYECNNGFKA